MTRRLAGTIAVTIALVAGLAFASPATAGAQLPTVAPAPDVSQDPGDEVHEGTAESSGIEDRDDEAESSNVTPGVSQTQVSPTQAAPLAQGGGALTGGFLDWGVKSSFRNYIVGPVAQGTITVEGGATGNPDGTFRFPLLADPDPVGSFDPSTGNVDAAFAGSVHFQGHCNHASSPGECLLRLSVSEVRIEATSTSGNLIADVVSLPLEGGTSNPQAGTEPVTYDDVVLATLDLTGVTPVAAEVDGQDGAAWLKVPSALGAGGAPAFTGFYAAGAPFDPVSFTLGLVDEVDLPEPPPTDDEEPGVVLDKTTVPVGGSLTASGGGFMPGEQVEVWIHSTPVWVGTAVADASGSVSYTFAVPPEVPPGEHRVELRGISSGLSLWSATFTVTPAGSGGAGSRGGRTLPNTGPGDLEGPLAAAGLALVLLGTVLAVGSRRVRRPGSSSVS